jgi:hypothetical protein
MSLFCGNPHLLRYLVWLKRVRNQSLISLYLVALFLLTYFGSPFESLV